MTELSKIIYQVLSLDREMEMGMRNNFGVAFTIFLIIFPYFGLGSNQDDCSVELRCKRNGPAVRFPFRLKGHHPKHCGYPGFDLSCSNTNETMMKLPYSGEFRVQTIDYESQFLDVTVPDSCIYRRLLQHLNFSKSPFYQDQENAWASVTFLNCSSSSDGKYNNRIVDCLGVPGYDVRAFATYERILGNDLQSCEKLQTISNVHLQGQAYTTFVPLLQFSWHIPVCTDCEKRGMGCRIKNNTRQQLDTECFNIIKHSNTSIKGRRLVLLVTGLTLGPLLLMVATIIIIKCYKAHNLDKIDKENQVIVEKFLKNYEAFKPTRFSYNDIKRITYKFKNMLGKGGYGSVYKGTIGKEMPVAVKLLNNSTGKGEDFTNEVGTIGTIHHVNIVRLLGFCADGFMRALVYEFLPNESLEKYIFLKNAKNPPLGWEKLLDIAIGIAKGIEYLHQGCNQRILHFDIKPHNILLDSTFKPKISDFGLAKLSSKGESLISMSAVRGTIGYIAPEVFSRNFGNVSYKSDVYSFGMLVLEMVGGRKNTDVTVENRSEIYFPEWAYKRLNQDKELGTKIEIDENTEIAKKLTVVALWCIQWHPSDRPSMRAVVQMLEGETENLVMPSNPFASTDEAESSSSVMAEKPSHDLLAVIPEINESE
ncbi:hypothetical protein GIB67_011253 [Kingdonia uniflora]|uniref:Protein kinase domain-containing protein n=1 Tax=Kingdonia uniflora TaxID=39325 RepID=A0A7J7NW18_9MAGN|nr:hypothetical protein GIB67_011253 [Kingdonia uniflora]